MAVTEITKIQLRRGKESELTSSTTLDNGEMGFASDTGRLFIGTDPTQTGLWQGRTVLPYENIEVLTEFSTDTFARITDNLTRMVGPVGMVEGDQARNPYLMSTLAATTTWTNVQIERQNPATGDYATGYSEDLYLSDTASVGALIDYFIFDSSNNLIRSGRMTINHDGNNTIDEAQLTDECTSRSELSPSSSSVTADQAYLTGIRFRAMRETTQTGPRFHFDYQNDTGGTLTMHFRVMVAAHPPTP